MSKLVRTFTLLCVLALMGAACEIEQVADPGVTPTLGPAPETGIERNVDPLPTDPQDPPSTEPGAPPATIAPAPSVSAPPTTTEPPTSGPGTTVPPTTAPPTTTPPTTTPPTTTVPAGPAPTPPPPVVSGSPIYFNDFAAVDSSDRLDQFVSYRDEFVVTHTVGASDHGVADGVGCTAPETTRPQTRDNPYDHVYLCHPGGDPLKGHQMAYAMDTAGYVFAGALPDQVFTGIREVRVDVNTTTAGFRNFVEIKVLPAGETFVNALPCGPDIPCNEGWDYDDVRGVSAGTNVQEGTGLTINTPAEPDGYQFDGWAGVPADNGDIAFPLCGPGFCSKAFVHGGNGNIRARYEHIFRDNGDGTLSFGIERADGSYGWVTAPGAFPTGDVRVVISFHNYTGTKATEGPGFDGNLSPSQGGFTWHWDNLAVWAESAVPSLTYFGGPNPDAMATPDGCIAFSQGQRNTPWHNDILPRFECEDGGTELVAFRGPTSVSPLDARLAGRTVDEAWHDHLAGEHSAFCELPTRPATSA
ncbi:MAG: hypothetical protein AAF081_15825 [Actinomycetota bacterium]